MPKYYPVMRDVRDGLAIVVGGARVAAEKAGVLSASGAGVHVIRLEFCNEGLLQAERKEVTLLRKTYEPGDLASAFVVIAATSDPGLVQAIWKETQGRGQLVNIVDMPEYCSFIMPSVLRREQLTIAVSTEGASPGLAKRIRHSLEAIFPPTYGPYLRLAALARRYLRDHGISYERRDDFFRDFFTADVLARLVEGDSRQAVARTAELLRYYDIEVSADVLEASLDDAKKCLTSD